MEIIFQLIFFQINSLQTYNISHEKKIIIIIHTCPYSSHSVFGKIASRAQAEVERAPSEHSPPSILVNWIIYARSAQFARVEVVKYKKVWNGK